MDFDLTDPVSPALKDAALLNLGWQPNHVVIDASSGELLSPPPAPPDPLPDAPPAPPPPLADWITFFGPFLHLTDAEVFQHLEAARLWLKTDGRIIFSFLDYDVPQHWQLFRQPAPPHFLNRATIEAWAIHLGMTLEFHYSGEVRWLQPLQSGAVEATAFGQSIMALTPYSA